MVFIVDRGDYWDDFVALSIWIYLFDNLLAFRWYNLFFEFLGFALLSAFMHLHFYIQEKFEDSKYFFWIQECHVSPQFISHAFGMWSSLQQRQMLEQVNEPNLTMVYARIFSLVYRSFIDVDSVAYTFVGFYVWKYGIWVQWGGIAYTMYTCDHVWRFALHKLWASMLNLDLTNLWRNRSRLARMWRIEIESLVYGKFKEKNIGKIILEMTGPLFDADNLHVMKEARPHDYWIDFGFKRRPERSLFEKVRSQYGLNKNR